jgi:hypothetical protein
MKVVLIGCAASEIMSACRLTISRLANEGHSVYSIIAPSTTSESPPFSENQMVPKLTAIGITRTFLLEKFDYSAITQMNADAVNSCIKSVEPSLVIMPSWKSPNSRRRILARASLIACRGIGTILMYELDAKNTSFDPVITFETSREATCIQETKSIEQDEIEIKTFTNESTLQKKASKPSIYGELEESFESHRTLLLEDQGLF